MATATINQIDPRQGYQKLKTKLHRQIVNSIDLSRVSEMSEGEFKEQLRALTQHICGMEQSGLSNSDRNQMVDEILDEIYGFGPLQAFNERS